MQLLSEGDHKGVRPAPFQYPCLLCEPDSAVERVELTLGAVWQYRLVA